jgi:RNA polymerase sigma-70 factor, ECF subfamily
MTWSGTDAELVALARRGDMAEAAAAAYSRFAEDVNRIVWRVLGADPEHDDVVHQVFVHVIAGLRSVRDPELLQAWMAAVCIKTVRSEIRNRRLRRFFQSGSEDPTRVAAPVEDHEARELLEKVYALLDRLPADERIAFALRYVDQRQLLEVAQMCRCSLATIKRRLARAELRFARLGSRDRAIAERLAETARAAPDATPSEASPGLSMARSRAKEPA